ncbi:MAG TPA: hypothetical protein VG474_17245, partial [Solirubrobacteraceae bacterium]|nr:hypothetical protein [Solirubrobacteraceae bacterium]
RLHEYSRVYAIPGLYEEVVQRRLRCETPDKLADLLLRCAADAGVEPRQLAAFDLGAGNGVLGEVLRERGVGTLIGSDNIAEARDAALRDRPDLYAEYLVGDTDELPQIPDLVREHGLNVLVAAGALGLGHVTAGSFQRLWSAFPAGSWYVVSLHEDLAEPGGSDFGDYLAALDGGDGGDTILARERYRHRLTMSGEPIHYLAIAVRKAT